MPFEVEGQRVALVSRPDDAIGGKKLGKNIQLFWTYHKFLDSLFPTETQNGFIYEKLFTNLVSRGLRD